METITITERTVRSAYIALWQFWNTVDIGLTKFPSSPTSRRCQLEDTYALAELQHVLNLPPHRSFEV
jgi:hypothetical protein